MIPQLLQPSCNVVVGLMLADVVDEQRSNSTPVICRCYGAISLLAGGVPNLRLDCLCVDLDRSRGKFNSDGGLRVEIEFVTCEATQQIRLADTRISDKNDCKEGMSARNSQRNRRK